MLQTEPQRKRGRPKGSKGSKGLKGSGPRKIRIRQRRKVGYNLTDDKTKWNRTQARKYAWDQFSWYIRLRDSKLTTGTFKAAKCITCGNTYPIMKIQAGHFMPGRSDTILFDEKGVHAQCYRCNVMLAGLWPAYYASVKQMYGQECIDEMLIRWYSDEVDYTVEDFVKIGDRYKATSVLIQMRG